MENILKNKKVKIIGVSAAVVIILYFLVISPIIKFKQMENKLLEASKRYYEINSTKLPTGSRITKVSLDTLYKKDFIQENMLAPYTGKLCDSDNSWVRVSKKGSEYQYDVYLECGLFKSKTDHKGPDIRLKGNENVVLYQGDKYKDPGIESVVDDTDGVIDIKKVKVSSNLNTKKVGTYKITYRIKDSLKNETIKERIIIVKQTLNNIVEKNTDKSNIYKRKDNNVYIKIDGMIFQIYGINSDGTVKIVSEEPLVSLNYDAVDEWENNYFYNLLSDNIKEYIVPSKWCDDNISDPDNYKECKKYSKKKKVGNLSVADYNNSKDKDGNPNIINTGAIWTSNSQNKNNAYISVTTGEKLFKNVNKEKIYNVKPVINIKKDAAVIAGNGEKYNPYILKGNKNKNKIGTKISEVKTGTWVDYSGYLWRVIETDEDQTTKIIMTNTVSTDEEVYYTNYANELDYYNPNNKNNIGAKVANEIPQYIKSDYFAKKEVNINSYKNKVLYGKQTRTKKYKLKYAVISMFDLFSPVSKSVSGSWYREIDKENKKVYVNGINETVNVIKYKTSDINGIRLVGYLDSKVLIKDGKGTAISPYRLMK